MRDRNPADKKALRRDKEKQKTFYCNKMCNKKRKNWELGKIRVAKNFLAELASQTEKVL